MIRPLVILLFITLNCLICSGQSYKLFTSDHDISSSLVMKVCQDNNGMIWVATEDGLNRYDGSKFIVFRNIPGDSTSLASNLVNTINVDSKGRTFIGSYAGLQLHDPATDTFSPLAKTPDGQTFASAINDLIFRKNGEIIVIGNKVGRIVKADNKSIVIEPAFTDHPEIEYVHNGIEDIDGDLWLLKEEMGTYRLDSDNNIYRYFGRPGDPVLTSITIGCNGVIYAGSMKHGLFQFDKKSDKFIPVNTVNNDHSFVKELYTDVNGEIYLATDGRGLKIFNPMSNQISDVKFGNGDLDYHKQKVHSVTKDDSNNLWLGIYQKGLVMLPAHPNSFKYIGHKSIANNVIGYNCVTTMCRDANGILWVGIDNDGVYGVNPDGTQYAHYLNPVPEVVINIFEDSRQNLWLGTYLNGAGILNRKTGQIEFIKLHDIYNRDVQRCYAFSEDNKGNIWIATMGQGLFSYNLDTKTTKQCDDLLGKIESWICTLHYSPANDVLYLGTYSGLYKIENPSGDRKISQFSPSSIIYSMLESKSGIIWVASSNGLIRFDPKTNSEKLYTTENGLPSNVIYAIQEDDASSLWISMNAGLAQFNPEKETFTTFYVEEGLQSNEFYKNASFKDKNGTIYFGGTNGITYFNPKNVIIPGRKWTVRVTDFYIHGKPIKAGMKSGARTITKNPVFKATEFKLSHADNSFSIEFGTREYNRPESLIYRYSLDNEKWIDLPHGTNAVNFSDVSPGSHTLRIVAVDNGIQSDESVITISIAPVWYNSWWAKLIYLIIVLGVIYYAYYVMQMRARRKREAIERNYEAQINEAKLQFFINISHEIRTPMTLVMSPLQKLMASDDNPARQKDYRTINRNAKRVLRLVNELMDIRKIDKGKMMLSFTDTPIVPFIDDLCDLFKPVADSKDITLTFDHEGHDDMELWVDPANFDKIIMNLLSNAVKYTPNGGKIDIKLASGTDDNTTGPLHRYAEISVTDTGIGIPESERQHIFKRFYQVRNNQTGGTGVGLHLTSSLIKLHYGTINIEDNPEGQGTRFVVRIPLGHEHLPVNQLNIPLAQSSVPKHTTNMVLVPDINETDNDNVKVKVSERVLVVEDDEEIRNYVAHELSTHYKVDTCANGKEALDIIFKQQPDLVISDVMMPEMDGLELTRRIKKNINLNHIPVVLLTAKSREEDNLEGLETGADAYLTKPFNIDILIKTVNNLLKSHQRLRNTFSGNQTHDEKVDDIDTTSSDDKLMERIMKVLNKNLGNPDITVETLANEIGISRVHLHRKLKELTNQSPRDFIRNTRLRKAAKLLVEKKLTVAEVADLTGFRNPNNFATSFKELFGVSPTVYMEQHPDSPEE